MLKVRVLLGLLIAALVTVGCFLWSQSAKDAREMLLGFDFLLLSAAVTMLVLSYLHITQAQDGKLVFDANSWAWKWWLQKFTEKGQCTVSLCLAYWQIVAGIFLLTGVIFVSILGLARLAFFGYAIYQGEIHITANDAKELFTKALPLIMILSMLVVAFIACDKADKYKSRWLWIIGESFAYSCLLSVFLSVEYFAIYEGLDKGKSLLGAALTLPSCIVLAFTAAAAVICLIIGIFRLSKVLSNTAFGRMLAAAKNGLCPMFELPKQAEPSPPAQNQQTPEPICLP